MLTFNPNKRPTVDQCIHHSYFDDIRDPFYADKFLLNY